MTTTALLVVDLDRRDRALSRLLLTADGRAATVLGLATVPGPSALLWLTLPPARLPHVTQALRRVVGVRDVTVARFVAPTNPLKHRVHVSDGTEVSMKLDAANGPRAGAGDGPTLLEATRAAVERCLGGSSPVERGWMTVHPVTGEAVAIVRGRDVAVHAASPTPEAATLSAVVAVHPIEQVDAPPVSDGAGDRSLAEAAVAVAVA